MSQETSIAAYEAAIETGLISDKRALVFKFIVEHQDVQMVSQRDCDRHFKDTSSSLHPRFKELVEHGVIEEVGTKKDLISGNNVKCYRTTEKMPVPLKREPRLRISSTATEFFKDLAENHLGYPNDPMKVVDQFISDWETRERVKPEYRTFK